MLPTTPLSSMAAAAVAAAIALTLSASSADATSILDTIRSKSELSSVAAAIAANPSWATGTNKTFIAPTDTAVAAGRSLNTLPTNETGVYFLPNQYVDYTQAANYQILLSDTNGGLVFDNWNPSGPPQIHLRSSTNEGFAIEQIPCDDGILYVSNISLEHATVPSVAGTHQPAVNKFLQAFTSLQATTGLDSLTNVTIFAPNDAAFAAIATQWSAYTENQQAAILAGHIAQTTVFSNSFGTAALTSLLSGQSLTIAVTGESATVNGNNVTIADTPTSAGAIHVINTVIIPSNLPAANGPVDVTIGVYPAVKGTGPASANSTSNSTSSSSSSSSSGHSSSKNSAANVDSAASGQVGGAVAVVAGLAAALVL